MNKSDFIYIYTEDEAINDGYLTKLTNLILMTPGVLQLKKKNEVSFEKELIAEIQKNYDIQPDIDLKGGNDKDFFSMNWRHTKFFVCANERGGLTIMLPTEY